MFQLSADSWVLWLSFSQYWLTRCIAVFFALFLAILRAAIFFADGSFLKLIKANLLALMIGSIDERASQISLGYASPSCRILPSLYHKWCYEGFSSSVDVVAGW